MKSSILRSAAFLVAALIAAPIFSFPAAAANPPQEPVSLTELIDHSKKYEDTVVCYQGEAVGDILYRGSSAWVNISDGNNSALGVFMPAQEARRISAMGHYGMKGDRLCVTGVFHRACGDHGGDMDIHASSVVILEKGAAVPQKLPHWLPFLAGGSAICAVLLCAFAFHRIKCYNNSH